ncbi:sugar phosphate isomerase/epimerase [bacterium]|nr:sugar phosphate isomerase/epimerase [bacterium]NUP94214.1 sugar phosphate isomerase/epimerase [Candidatus Omnitrophota bacterium]
MKYSICNELFGATPFEEVCRIVAGIGYHGIEVAPFTLAEDPRTVDSSRRAELRSIASRWGIEIVGLHWLLVSPKGFHLTTEDVEVRENTLAFLESLMDLCADLGGKVMILGSPMQRNLDPDQDRIAVEERLIQGFRRIGDYASGKGVTLCFEALDRAQTNFIQTPQEAFDLVQKVDSPGFQMMVDSRASFEMGLEPGDQLRRFLPAVRHVHLNDRNKLGPGMGDCDFAPLFLAGKETGFTGYFSVEVFDFTPGPEKIARDSFSTIARLHQQVFGSSI